MSVREWPLVRRLDRLVRLIRVIRLVRFGRRPGRDGLGSGTLLSVAVMMIMLAIAASVAVLARYALAVHQAQNAADLAALAGAQSRGVGEDACQTARRIARSNGALLQTCRVDGDQQDFVLTVRVSTGVIEPVLGFPTTVTRQSHAGPVR